VWSCVAGALGAATTLVVDRGTVAGPSGWGRKSQADSCTHASLSLSSRTWCVAYR
jgi:hypothetical protein